MLQVNLSHLEIHGRLSQGLILGVKECLGLDQLRLEPVVGFGLLKARFCP